MSEPTTREEALEFVRTRKKDIESGNRWAAFHGIPLSDPNDDAEKQVADYKRIMNAFDEQMDRIKYGRELIQRFVGSLSPPDRMAVELYLEELGE